MLDSSMSAKTRPDSDRHSELPIASPAIERFANAERLDIEQIREILPDLIDALADPVLVVDSERRVVAANRCYIDTFGLKRSDAVGLHCHDAVHCPELGRGGRSDSCVACDV